MADDPGLSSAQRQVLIAPNRRLSVERAQAYAQSARGAAQDILDAVTLRDVSTITLAARKTKVPFRFRNQLQQPVTVSLRIRSDRLRLSDAGPDDRLDLVLPPGQSTSEVSVEVLTSGVFAVTADVMTSSGNEVLQRQEFQVRSRLLGRRGGPLGRIAPGARDVVAAHGTGETARGDQVTNGSQAWHPAMAQDGAWDQ